jgi:hypothetical protein
MPPEDTGKALPIAWLMPELAIVLTLLLEETGPAARRLAPALAET